MGLPPGLAACAIRISLGWGTVAADIDRFLDAWSTVTSRMSGRLSGRSPITDR